MMALIDAMRLNAPLLVVLAPLLACPIAALTPSGRAAWVVGVAGALGAATVAIAAASAFDGVQIYRLGGWPAPFGVAFKIDGLGAYALAVTSVIAALAMIAALGALRADIDRQRQPLAIAFVLAALTAANGLIVAADFFVLFAFLLWLWLALAALIALGMESDRRAGPAAFDTLMLGAASAVLFAFGAGFVFLATGAVDLDIAAGVLNAAEHARSAAAGLALMGLAAIVLAGLAPLNGWALGAFARGPAFVSLALGAVTALVGAVLAGRLIAFAASAAAPGLSLGVNMAMSVLGCVSVIAGSVQAMAARDFRRMIVNIAAVQAGCVLIGFSAASGAGIAGGLFHLANEAAALLVLFCAAAALSAGRGAVSLDVLDGLFRRAPFLSVVIAVTLLSLIGAPMTAGFLSRWSLLQATLEARIWWGAAAIILSSLAAVAYTGRVFGRMFLSAPAEGTRAKIASMAPALVLATAVTLAFGFSGSAALSAAEAAAGSLSWGAP